MVFSEEFREVIIKTIQENIENLKSTSMTFERSSKTPQKVTNFLDFHFGVYLGGIKNGIGILFRQKFKRELSAEEWDELDKIFIDKQDEIGNFFYK